MDTIRWGILGTGSIARKFAQGLRALPDARLVAVGSRRQETADAFGREYDAPNRHASYEALAHDPDVDAIYVATPHSLHRDNTILCLEAGKPVLCEKPFAINDAEAREMVACARERQVFLMEAMWSRFLPAIVELRRLLAEGVLGELQMLTADFGFRAGSANPRSRLFNPELGGGALLDVGVYPVSLASMIFGTPRRATSLACIGETAVDEHAGIVLSYDAPRMAVLYTSIRTTTPQEAYVLGANGSIRVDKPWWVPKSLTVSVGEPEQIPCTYVGNGYNYEAAEVMSCLREGRLESEIMPLDETVSIIQTLTELRRDWGLRYPGES